MSEKRKRIFKEALFLLPFMFVVTAVSLLLMFFVGRDIRDVMNIVTSNSTSDKNMDISDYSEYESKKYTLEYYYGDESDCVKYAEYTENSRGDDTTRILVLHEPRDGFEAGTYKTEWFYSTEYVSFTPTDGEEDNTQSYSAEEQPYMYDYVLSYSYSRLLTDYGAQVEKSKGYKVLGIISAYTWDSSERKNYLLGLGGNPKQFYSYLNNSNTEYKKVLIK